MRTVCSLFLLAIYLALPLLAQEPMPADSDPAIGAGALAWGWSELVKYAIPAAGSYGIYYANVVKGWIAELNNPLKIAVSIVFVAALTLLGELVNATVSSDPANWSAATFEGLAAGILTTVLVKIGITTARQRSTTTAKPFGTSLN